MISQSSIWPHRTCRFIWIERQNKNIHSNYDRYWLNFHLVFFVMLEYIRKFWNMDIISKNSLLQDAFWRLKGKTVHIDENWNRRFAFAKVISSDSIIIYECSSAPGLLHASVKRTSHADLKSNAYRFGEDVMLVRYEWIMFNDRE
jgi:hypothetical protein